MRPVDCDLARCAASTRRFVTRRPASPALCGLLGTFWANPPSESPPAACGVGRERALPTGDAHLVFRLALLTG